MRLSVLALVLIPSMASAADLPLWQRADWDPTTPGRIAEVEGTDGWIGGYAADTWRGSFENGALLVPRTDDNEGDSQNTQGFGDGGPSDNWLIRGESFRSGAVRLELGNDDDDALGAVISHDGDDTFYLLLHSADSAPPPVNAVDRAVLVLLRVEGGDATELGRANVDPLTQDVGNPDGMMLRREGDRLRAFFNGRIELNVVDPNPLDPGQAGVYAYDNGGDPSRFATVGWFDTVDVTLLDTDDDRVPDDDDNCVADANEDQADADGDGIGDVCDPTPNPPGGDDTATPPGDDTGSPPGDDTGSPPGDDTGSPPGDDTAITGDDTGTGGPPVDPGQFTDEDLVAAACGCRTGAGGAPLWLLAGLLAFARRRPRA